MPKKPVKIIVKFSNDSTVSEDNGKKGKGKAKGGGPNNNSSTRRSNGPRKLRP